MPYKNTVRFFAENLHYHIYNRGIEKRTIFQNQQDYYQFLSIIDYYLTPKNNQAKDLPNQPTWRKSLEENEIELLCYCLIPNHFHLLIKQNTANGITRFMRRLSNTYVQYFNKQNDRKGALFEGKYKAVIIETDEYLLHLSRYIHRNPLKLDIHKLKDYEYSSYPEYLQNRQTPWINTSTILDFYKTPINSLSNKPDTYQNFVENYDFEEKLIQDLILD